MLIRIPHGFSREKARSIAADGSFIFMLSKKPLTALKNNGEKNVRRDLITVKSRKILFSSDIKILFSATVSDISVSLSFFVIRFTVYHNHENFSRANLCF